MALSYKESGAQDLFLFWRLAASVYKNIIIKTRETRRKGSSF